MSRKLLVDPDLGEPGYRVDWDEEHILGARSRGADAAVDLCGSVLEP